MTYDLVSAITIAGSIFTRTTPGCYRPARAIHAISHVVGHS